LSGTPIPAHTLPAQTVVTLPSRHNLHWIYAAVIVVIVAIGAIVANSLVDHARDDAKRDAVIEAKNSTISDLEQRIASEKAIKDAALQQIDERIKDLQAHPAQAPSVIHEIIPGFPAHSPDASKANQSQPTTQNQAKPAETGEPPDSPGYVLTQQDQQKLAEFILGCKQCAIERDQLQSQVADQQQVIDAQKVQLAAAIKAAKGGSVWQRTKRAFKYLSIGGAIGAIAVEATHR